MHFLQILTLVLFSRCSCVQEHSRLKLPQLPLVSQQGLQEAEDCSFLPQGFANCQTKDGFVILICLSKRPLILNRPYYLLLQLFPLSYFTRLCFTSLGHGHWMSEWKVTDSRCIQHVRKRDKTQAGLRERHIQKAFRMVKHRQMEKSTFAFVKPKEQKCKLLFTQVRTCLSGLSSAFSKIINKKGQAFIYRHI